MANVHACKTCHRKIFGQPHKDHPNYLSGLTPKGLFLNLIDPPIPLFRIETFWDFLGYALPIYQSGNAIMIHCDVGQSRSRSLALVLAARVERITHSSFDAAADEFSRPTGRPYRPGKGIETFLRENWMGAPRKFTEMGRVETVNAKRSESPPFPILPI